MKNLIYIVLLLFAISQGANAYNPAQYVEDNWEEEFSDEYTDRQVYDSQVNEEVEVAGSDEDYKKTWEENRAGKIQEEEKFYEDPKFSACEEPSNYVCPALVEEKVKLGFRNRINYIDLESGKISCSILRPLRDDNTPATIRSEIPYYTEVFTNEACVEKYSPTAAHNKDDSEEIKSLIEENMEFIEELKQQEHKYTVDYKYNGDDEFLDLADVLDGIVSFDTNLFDFEQTLLTRKLKTRDGFTTLPNETVATKLEESWGNLLHLWDPDYSKDDFYENSANAAKIRDVASSIANSNYFMLLDFWSKSNDIMVLMAQGLAILFIGYNVIFTWIMPGVSNKMQKQPSGENNPQRIGFGLIALIMLFSGEVDRLNIEYESKTQDVVTSELVIQQTNIQRAVQLLYSETNYWADSFAEVGISAYLNNLTSSTGLFSDEQIEALATERIILTNALEAYQYIDVEMCFNNYDVNLLKEKLDEYRDKTLNKNSGRDYGSFGISNQYSVSSLFGFGHSDVSELRVNPYPKSEREVNAMMYGDQERQIFDNISAYNSSSSIYNGGMVDSSAIHKFRDSFHSPLTLSGCYLNKKKMTESHSRLQEIEDQFAKLADRTKKDAKVEYLKVVHDIQWGLFAKQGYIAIAYLPATAMLIDNLGIVGDASERTSAIEEAATNSEDIATEFATNGLQMVAEDMVYLSMFGGFQIAKIVHPVKSFILENAGDALSSFTGPLGKGVKLGTKIINKFEKFTSFGGDAEIDILDLKIAAFLLKNVLEVLISVTLIVGSILIFTLLFIEKLFAFVASMFLLIYAFAKNQEERLTTAFAKIFAVAFKTILIVVCVFLAIYSIDLVNSLEILFVESFFTTMDTIENASWGSLFTGGVDLNIDGLGAIGGLLSMFFKKYIFYGVTKVAFVILKLVLVIQMIWKMPGYMYELMYEKVQSVSDGVGDTLQSANERHTMKV